MGRSKSDVTDRVRALAEAGVSARTIAESLGISRQRVYQIAQAAEIKLPKAPPEAWSRGSLDRRPIQSIPRLVTGGVPVAINASVAGTICELLAAGDLLARGWQAYIPITRQGGHDLIAVKGDMVRTIEVRCGHRNGKGALRYNKQAKDRSQHYAVVITGEPVIYLPELP